MKVYKLFLIIINKEVLMKKGMLFVIPIMLFSIALFGMQSSFSTHQETGSIIGSGGPDSYGYTWIDSDESGGPVFNWIDITGIGTKVYGLSDDNNVGPFPIGFDFPYYWYTVNQFWVESNGGISFSDANVYVPQGSSGFPIPNTTPPNDIVIPLGADISFQDVDTAECYYYSNNVDTFVISFLKVPAWTMSGLLGQHTFQIILTREDSCIYFQYGPQQGTFYQGADVAGIEDVIGDVGLQVFINKDPNTLPNYAVKFIPPDSTSYQALDIGLSDAISPGSKGIFVYPNDPASLWATIKNYGNVDAGSFTVTCSVMDTTGSSQYADTITVSGLTAGSDTTVYFTPNWVPTSVNDYIALVQTHLSGDINPTNNSKDVEIEVITIPGWLMYDSDPTSGAATHWLGAGGGWGQEFVPPQYPITIDSVLVTMASPNNVNVPILFMDDDGPGGSPGTILFSDTVFVQASSGFSYYTIHIPSSVNTITSGAFFVGMIQLGDSFPNIILENSGPSPYSRRGWEFTGSWAPYRDRDASEFLIRAYTSSTQGVAQDDKEKNGYKLSLLAASPNPIKDNAIIRYSLPSNAMVTLKVYNIIGQEVKTLVNGQKKAGVHSVVFNTKKTDGSVIPQGVYFYRLTVGNRTLTRKLTVLR